MVRMLEKEGWVRTLATVYFVNGAEGGNVSARQQDS